MLTNVCQRWYLKCARFVPPSSHFDPRLFDVAEIEDDATPRAFVKAHHYSGSYPNAWRRFGLFERGELVGCAVFSVPQNMAVLRPFPLHASAELGRFVLLDRVGFDAETWFLKRCAGALRTLGLAGFVMFSDPNPRRDASGAVVFPGHTGTIYRAFSAPLLKYSRAETEFLLPDGRSFARRALSKIRARAEGDRGELSCGWRYAVRQLVDAGAPMLGRDLGAWLDRVETTFLRAVKRPGKLKYAFALHPKALSSRLRTKLPPSLPYPRIERLVCAPFEGRAAP